MDIKNITKFIVRTDTLDAFLNDIKGIKPMTVQEEKDAFARYEVAETKEEKTAIRNEIIMRNIWFIYAVAKRYDANEREDSKVLEYVNMGVIGMTEAFDNYDVNSGNRFCTFSVWYIRRAINGYTNNEDMLIVPTNHQRVSPKVKKITEEFYKKEHRDPTPDEIKDILFEEYDIDIDRRDLYGLTIDYIDDSVKEESDTYTVEETSDFNECSSVENNYEEMVEKESLSYQMESAMGTLNERARKVIKMAFGIGYDKQYKDHEIAEELGLTSERVRQIRHESIKNLRSAYLNFSV